MLTIGKLGAGQEAYYLEKVADGAEDYYSGEGEAPGRWTGAGAEELGLEGVVVSDELRAMLTGRHPAGGEPLVDGRGVCRSQGPVPGFDLTFSAPKSVSLLWGLGDGRTAEAVRAAHERSVDAALAYMEREACWARRGKGGAEFVRGKGFVAAAFRHRASRAGDPQLHTHVLIANATRGPDGRYTRLYHPAIYDHARTAGYLYEANLRHELSRELGVSWQPVRRGIAELEGFSDAQLRRFSTRRGEILEATGGPEASRRARQTAALATRRAKDYSVSAATLAERWREAAREVGLSREQLDNVAPGRALGRAEAARISVKAIERAVVAERSHFDRRDVLRAIAEALPEGAPAFDVERQADGFLGSDRVVRIAEHPCGDRYTTAHIARLEREALDGAEQLSTAERARVGERIAREAIARRPALGEEQREMVRRLLCGGEGLVIVVGEAGTGKSFATVAAAEGWARAGVAVRAAAPTRRAAAILSADGLEATSVAALLRDLDTGTSSGQARLERGSVLVIDEAGMVASADLARLIDHAERSRAKLVLIGDHEQLGELEAGGLFRALAERSDPIRLRHVSRQRHELEREAAKRIREGRGGEAWELYRSEERVVVASDRDRKRDAIVADWFEAFSRGDDALMIAKRRAEVAELNASARASLRDAGLLGATEIDVGGERFAVGDLVVTRVNSTRHGAHNRERWQVTEVHPQTGRVELRGVDDSRSVALDADYLARRTPRDEAPALQHCYAATIYVAQGSTVDRAFVCADPSLGRQEFYVAASRSREETRFYAVAGIEPERASYAPHEPAPVEELGEIRAAIERDGAQRAAVDEAIRAQLAGRSTRDLVAARAELREVVADREGAARIHTRDLMELERATGGLAAAHGRLDAAQAQRRPQSHELAYLRSREELARQGLERIQQEMTARAPASGSRELRAELAVIDSVLAERRRLAITAARISPPAYVTRALGERPAEPGPRAHWEAGLNAIERYRQEHGVRDRENALGRRPREAAARIDWARTSREVQQSAERIRGRELARSMELGR
jgi:conjugative relaxase-like TrwC/TraI family protein